jgi:hypothetical protein
METQRRAMSIWLVCSPSLAPMARSVAGLQRVLLRMPAALVVEDWVYIVEGLDEDVQAWFEEEREADEDPYGQEFPLHPRWPEIEEANYVQAISKK